MWFVLKSGQFIQSNNASDVAALAMIFSVNGPIVEFDELSLIIVPQPVIVAFVLLTDSTLEFLYEAWYFDINFREYLIFL